MVTWGSESARRRGPHAHGHARRLGSEGPLLLEGPEAGAAGHPLGGGHERGPVAELCGRPRSVARAVVPERGPVGRAGAHGRWRALVRRAVGPHRGGPEPALLLLLLLLLIADQSVEHLAGEAEHDTHSREDLDGLHLGLWRIRRLGRRRSGRGVAREEARRGLSATRRARAEGSANR